MPEAQPSNAVSPREAWIVTAMLAMVAVPAAITLNTVRYRRTLQVGMPNPTPYGYTISLLLFIVPILVIALWFHARKDLKIPGRAFWWTLGLLIPLGCGLDFFFARWFFLFPNAGATLGLGAPAIGGPVPVEEYVFYTTGFLAVLLIYVWLGEFWLAAYNVPDYPREARKLRRLLHFHTTSLSVGLGLILAAIAYKKGLSATPDGFPGYFTFLIAAAFVPSVGFFPVARPLINWRAFSLTLFLILLVSLLWEATLAIPYGWWGYQPKQMMGVFINGWSGLPIEAVVVWIAVTYATTIVFEVLKLWQASERPARDAFLGAKVATAQSEETSQSAAGARATR